MKIPINRTRFWPPIEVPTADPLVGEMQGFSGIGAHEDALKTARKILGRERNAGEAFYAALQVIMKQEDNLEKWKDCVERAYGRLARVSQKEVRFWMVVFHASCGNYARVAELLPKRFSRNDNLLELCYAMDAMLALGRLEEAAKLVPKIGLGIKAAAQDEMKDLLTGALADYFARVKQWGIAADLWRALAEGNTMAESGIKGLVDIGVAQALDAVETGLIAIERLRKSFDPEVELTLPGNEKKRWNELEKHLLERKKALEKLMPAEDRRRFGIG